jgi:outer membrane protein OmpA-like peptidoglycan-associated protein
VCARVAKAIEDGVNKYIDAELNQLVLNIHGKAGTNNRLDVGGDAPSVKAKATVNEKTKTIAVQLTFTQGRISVTGKASMFGASGPISGSFKFPKQNLAQKNFSFRCDVDSCRDFVTKGVEPLINAINQAFLAKLPTDIPMRVNDVPLVGSVDATASVTKWPRLNDAEIVGDKVVVTSSPWGPARFDVDSIPIAGAISVGKAFAGLRVALPCALSAARGEDEKGENTGPKACGQGGPCPPPPPAPSVCGNTSKIRLQVQFKPGKTRIEPSYLNNPEQLNILRTFASDIKDGCKVVLTGNTECSEAPPAGKTKQDLSLGRANAVRQMLGDDTGPNVAIRMVSAASACKNAPRNRFVEIATSVNTAAQTGPVDGYVVATKGYHCDEYQSKNAACNHYARCTPVTIHPTIKGDTKELEGLEGQTVNWASVDIKPGAPKLPTSKGGGRTMEWMPLFDVLPGPVSDCRR